MILLFLALHFTFSLSPRRKEVVSASAFYGFYAIGSNPSVPMRKKIQSLELESDLSVDLTLHHVPASLLADFAQKIVQPYFRGNLNAAIQDLLNKALVEQNFVHSHITHVRITEEQQLT